MIGNVTGKLTHAARRFMPFSEGNDLADAVSVSAVHLGLAFMGLIGLVIWLWETKIVE